MFFSGTAIHPYFFPFLRRYFYMAIPRRRQQCFHRSRYLIHAISAALLLYLFISFLAPSPVDHDRLHRPIRSFMMNNGIDRGKGEPLFHVPIIDAVVAVHILNATLVVPKLETNSFGKDTSNFSEIFDVDWFMSYLANDVEIIKELPQRSGQMRIPYVMRVPRRCGERCYAVRLLPLLLKKHAVLLTKFNYRLSNELETDLQKLRCRVNYHALKFTSPILEMGAKLVQRMRNKNKHFIALHLWFEPDMLAFSGCYYGGGNKERRELDKIRCRWKTLHNSNPGREKCKEDALLLLRKLV